MTEPDLVPIEGSAYNTPAAKHRVGPYTATDPIVLLLAVRHRPDHGGPDSGSDPADIDRIEQFARDSSLTVLASSADRRRVEVEGDPATICETFGVRLDRFERDGAVHRHHVGAIHVPRDLSGVVTGVFGLDDVPIRQRSPLTMRPLGDANHTGRPAITPEFLCDRYRFPSSTGVGQRVGLIEMGGGYRRVDLEQFCAPKALPSITDVCVHHGANRPEPIEGVADLMRWMRRIADGEQPTSQPPQVGRDTIEVTMDIELVTALAPGAEIVVYFTDESERGLLAAFEAALDPHGLRPSVISLSWSWPERGCQLEREINNLLHHAAFSGVTVCVASGDYGSRGDAGEAHEPPALQPQFPATSPWVLACGGTAFNFAGGNVESEVVWQTKIGMSSGGGVSEHYRRPSWQARHDVPATPGGFVGRGVPDVASVADPASLVEIVAGGEVGPAAGTSASAPLWAALVARIAQAAGRSPGLLNPLLYELVERGTPATLDIVEGTNGAYSARPGWDACTGLGAPQGRDLLDEFLSR